MALGRSISKQYFNSLVEKFRSSPLRYMQVDDKAQFAKCYNREAFLIRHMLHDHPLFTLDALFDLCRRLPEIDIKCRVGSIPVDAHFDSSLGKYRGDLTLEQAIAGFPDNQAYIAIYNPEMMSGIGFFWKHYSVKSAAIFSAVMARSTGIPPTFLFPVRLQ